MVVRNISSKVTVSPRNQAAICSLVISGSEASRFFAGLLFIVSVFFLTTLPATLAYADNELLGCRALTDQTERLSCYDRLVEQRFGARDPSLPSPVEQIAADDDFGKPVALQRRAVSYTHLTLPTMCVV